MIRHMPARMLQAPTSFGVLLHRQASQMLFRLPCVIRFRVPKSSTWQAVCDRAGTIPKPSSPPRSKRASWKPYGARTVKEEKVSKVKPAAKAAQPGYIHFILTRFNVKNFYHCEEPTDEWLKGRLDLFRTYCLPSFEGQTNKNFRWLVFVDSESPEWFLSE